MVSVRYCIVLYCIIGQEQAKKIEYDVGMYEVYLKGLQLAPVWGVLSKSTLPYLIVLVRSTHYSILHVCRIRVLVLHSTYIHIITLHTI